MTDFKFSVMTERELGRVDEEQLAKWKSLIARKKRITASARKLDKEAHEFMESILETIDSDEHPSAEGVRILDDGRIVQMYCECYRCQTHLQNLPASVVVESMIEQQKILPEAIAEARAWAARTEKKLGQNFVN